MKIPVTFLSLFEIKYFFCGKKPYSILFLSWFGSSCSLFSTLNLEIPFLCRIWQLLCHVLETGIGHGLQMKYTEVTLSKTIGVFLTNKSEVLKCILSVGIPAPPGCLRALTRGFVQLCLSFALLSPLTFFTYSHILVKEPEKERFVNTLVVLYHKMPSSIYTQSRTCTVCSAELTYKHL